MLPGAGGQTVVARQRIRVRPDIGRALHVIVAAEDVGATAGDADVAEHQLQDTHGADVGVTDRVLRLAHTPDDGGRLILGHHLGNPQHFGLGNAGHVLDLVRGPFHDFFLDLVDAVHAGLQVLLVFPAVLEDMIEQAPDERDVGARADAAIHVGLGGGTGKARIDDGDLAAIFLGMQQVQHRHRVRLGSIRTDVQRCLRVLHVVVGVGHRAVTPGIGDAGNRGRVADAGLMVHVVRAEEGHELAHQVGLLVAVLRRADPVGRIRAAFLADRQQLFRDFVERLFPGDLLVFAVDQLHRVLQAMFAMAVLAHRGALGAVRAEIDRRVKNRLLTGPDTVLDHGIDGTADRTVGTDGALDLDTAGALGRIGGIGRADHVVGQLRGDGTATGHQTGTLEEAAAIHGRGKNACRLGNLGFCGRREIPGNFRGDTGAR